MGRRRKGYRKFFKPQPKGCRPYNGHKRVHKLKGISLPCMESARMSFQSRDCQTDDLSPTSEIPAASASCAKVPQVVLIDCVAEQADSRNVLHAIKQPVRPRIRVLSFYDGISTGLHVLDKLGFDVEMYYSCEVDEKAIQLQKFRFNDRITRLGSVNTVSKEKLECLAPIHLLIGGSPCSDLSLVNFRRRGLHDPSSTGGLFYSFAESLGFLKQQSQLHKTPFYWLFENTFSMEKGVKLEISRCLGCSPKVICASNFTPMKRRRYFWGNIFDIKGSSLPTLPSRQSILQDYLKSYRKANVKVLNTLTTKANSQRSGKQRKLPAVEDGKDSLLFIVEQENLFGFPEGYTDGPNLSISDRRVLLGKAWSVNVIEYILQVLKPFFKLLR